MGAEKVFIVYCGALFDPSPRTKIRPRARNHKVKKAKKSGWQRHKMRTDHTYKARQPFS
jgi:hypothetical protein